MLKTEHLTKEFGGLRAIDDLCFSVGAAELRCIIGPNGAGKSTLFNLITGFLKPTSGKIFYKGEEISHLLPHQIARRGIGRKFQVPNIYDNLTIRENVRLPTEIHARKQGVRRAAFARRVEEQIDQILEQVRLTDKQHQGAANISHGERQWLEIGMVLAMQPQLLLLDEPTAGMSARETHETAEIIRSLAEEIAIIVIEHDINFIREIAQKITVMHNGALLMEGTLRDVERDDRVRTIYLGEHHRVAR